MSLMVLCTLRALHMHSAQCTPQSVSGVGWDGVGLGWGGAPTEAPGSKSFCSVKEATTNDVHTTTLSTVVSERFTQGTRNSQRNSPLSTCPTSKS